ncbi:MAG: cobalamin-binding protein [Gammaproteobacteria bacterium]|nr:MAG: cobalamin-binding protein [Gammaproteobacteria bacterium]
MMRIVSTTCSNTEIVCALGCEQFLVGVDDHSDYPEAVVSKLPRVGPDLQVDAEKIVSLKPDLVLASLTVPGHENVLESLQKAGLTYRASAPETIEAVYDDIIDIAERLGVAERGLNLVTEMREQIKPVGGRAGKRPSIAIQWWPKPVIIAGKKSWVHDLIELAGGRNLLESEETTSSPLEFEWFAALNPDIIVMSWCGVKAEKYRASVVTENPLLSSVSAVLNGRVIPISEAFLGRPSVRLVEGYRLIKEAVDRFHKELAS